MKKFIWTVILISLLSVASVFSWFTTLKPFIEGNANFEDSGQGIKWVTVPISWREYVNVPIDGINNSTTETNHLNVWQFEDVRILRTVSPVEGESLGDGVMYSSNQQVFKKFGNFYIVVTSPTKHVGVTADNFGTSEIYTAPCPEMTGENRIESLPEWSLPENTDIRRDWKIKQVAEEAAYDFVADDVSYYEGRAYFNYNFRYVKMADAKVDAATRVCALSHKPLDWWYQNGNVFIVKSGDEYACINQRDYTSCYFMSSNDLGYIMMNIQ